MTQSLNQVLRQMRAKYPRATYVVDDVPMTTALSMRVTLTASCPSTIFRTTRFWRLMSLRRPTASLSASRKRPSTKSPGGWLNTRLHIGERRSWRVGADCKSVV